MQVVGIINNGVHIIVSIFMNCLRLMSLQFGEVEFEAVSFDSAFFIIKLELKFSIIV